VSFDTFIHPTSFMGGVAYVTLDDDHTSAFMINVGGLSVQTALQDSEYKYQFVQD